jgi:hypothetical protein
MAGARAAWVKCGDAGGDSLLTGRDDVGKILVSDFNEIAESLKHGSITQSVTELDQHSWVVFVEVRVKYLGSVADTPANEW